MAWVSRSTPQITLICDPSSTAGKSVLRMVRAARPANITFTPSVPLGAPLDEAPPHPTARPTLVPTTRSTQPAPPPEEDLTEEQQEDVRLADAASSARPIPTIEGESPTSFLSHLPSQGSGGFNLDVQDRSRAPITSTQLSTILAYLPREQPAPPPPPPPPAPEASTETSQPDGAAAAEANTYGGGSQVAIQRAKTKARIEAALRAFEERNQASARRRNESVVGSDTPVESLVPPGVHTMNGSTPHQVLDAVADDLAASLEDDAPKVRNGSSPASIVRSGGPVLVWWDEGKAATSTQEMRTLLDQVIQQSEQPKSSSCCIM